MTSKSSPLSELNGIIPSLHTPFKNDKSIDYKSLENLIKHTINTKCAGMLVTAVAGETNNLTYQEKENIVEFILDVNRNQIPVIVGCSSQKIDEIYTLVEMAKKNLQNGF